MISILLIYNRIKLRNCISEFFNNTILINNQLIKIFGKYAYIVKLI